jgi:hypothetical protein
MHLSNKPCEGMHSLVRHFDSSTHLYNMPSKGMHSLVVLESDTGCSGGCRLRYTEGHVLRWA